MRRLVLSILVIGSIALAGASEPVSVGYLGHSCFTIQASEGPIIMIDPYASYVPFPALPQPADVVLMTHAHIDHCPPCHGEANRYTGDPIVVAPWDSQGRIREGNWRITDDVLVRFTEASHVTAGGGGQGYVCLFSFEVGGIRFAHLGDVGKLLTGSQMAALAGVEVLFLPVGGAYTINAAEAMTVIAQLPSVKVVLPMHYRVDGITPWPDMAPLTDFTVLADTLYPVLTKDADQVIVDSESLPESVEIWVLDFKK